MPSNYGTVSRRLYETLKALERSPIVKAAAAVSDAAMVSGGGDPGMAQQAPPQPMPLPEELRSVAEDPALSPAERAVVLQAAERIELLMAPAEPEGQPMPPGAPPEGAMPPPPPPEEGAVPPEGEPAEAAVTDEQAKVAYTLNFDHQDFAEVVTKKRANALFMDAATDDGVMAWLRSKNQNR